MVMLHYSNIINDPYPDTIDPVTGEWLPKSYNQVKAESIARAQNQLIKSNTKALAGMLSSILK